MVGTTLEGERAPSPETTSRRSSQHRPYLDGLRAVAVYLVVLYHAGMASFESGYIGVDVFFVLSGYLVTQLLLRDINGRGRVRIRYFYSRRYRRLLPAFFVAVLVTALAVSIVATRAEIQGAIDSFKASFLYSANWYFVHQSADYFATDVNQNPVVHLWSLAVEEQFYLLWPLLLTGLAIATRRLRDQMRTIRIVCCIAAVLSASEALYLGSANVSRAYYGTDTRAYQLLLGAILALTPSLFAAARRHVRATQGIAIASLVVIVLLATPLSTIGVIQRGIVVAVATAVLIVGMEASTARGTARRTLSVPEVAYLGRISYATYLWHWPVIFVVNHEFSLVPWKVAVIACVVATALAGVSYHLIEQPIRTSRRLDPHWNIVIATGLAVTIVAGLVIAPAILRTGQSSTTVAGAENLDWKAALDDIPTLPDCRAAAPEKCTIVHGTGPHVLLVGDSNARMWIPTFVDIAKKENLTLSVASTPLCPWQEGLFFVEGSEVCTRNRGEWYSSIIPALDPDIIVLGQAPMDDDNHPIQMDTPGGRVRQGTPAYEAQLEALSSKSLQELAAPGRKVVILEPIPIASSNHDPIDCLSSATSPDQCAYRANPTTTTFEKYLRGLAQDGSVWTLDLDRMVCPALPRCDAIANNMIVKRDINHLTATYATSLSPAVEALLKQNGILGG